MYILDTNVISAVRRADRAPQVAAWLRGKPEDQLFLSVITLGEIQRGIEKQRRRDPDFADDLQVWLERTLTLFSDRILPFGAKDALVWGRLSAQIGHSGADLMIAASGIANNATVVTGNPDDFRPTGVLLENPF